MIVLEIMENTDNLYNVFGKAEKINVYKDGVITEYLSGGEEYAKILLEWNKMIEGAHDMPAFGVSIDNLTREEAKKGLWAEFDFGKSLVCNGMPFEKLLICVKEDFYGFNLVRYTTDAGYYGRCYYFDLVNKNMADFQRLLESL